MDFPKSYSFLEISPAVLAIDHAVVTVVIGSMPAIIRPNPCGGEQNTNMLWYTSCQQLKDVTLFKDLQVTLYDFFGYLLPGAAILAAAIVLFWTLFWPLAPLTLPSTLPVLATTSLVFIAYLAGHLGQALGNILEKVSPGRAKLDKDLPLSSELTKLVTDAAVDRFGDHTRTLQAKELLDLCDQTLVHSGSLGEREIFTYREGFYRGNAVALALVTLALVVRLVCAPALVAVGSRDFEIYRAPLALAASLTALSAWLCYARFLRFAEHRYRSCFLRFLALTKEPEQS